MARVRDAEAMARHREEEKARYYRTRQLKGRPTGEAWARVHPPESGRGGAPFGNQNALKHGGGAGGQMTPEYRAWRQAKNRTTNPAYPKYARYGGRGISMAEEWRDDFLAFLTHIGLRPTPQHSLDRIDNSRGYEPGNVRWATAAEQAANRG